MLAKSYYKKAFAERLRLKMIKNEFLESQFDQFFPEFCIFLSLRKIKLTHPQSNSQNNPIHVPSYDL